MTPPAARPNSAGNTPVFTENSRTASCEVEYASRVLPRSSEKNAWLSSAPSISTLFISGLTPRIETSPYPLESDTTPGVVSARLDQRRLFIGAFTICALFSVSENCGDSKFISGVTAVTSTVWVSPPSDRCGRSSVDWLTWTITWSCTKSLNPVDLIVTLYSPGCNSGALKYPLSSAVSVVSALVASLCTTTLACGTTAPVASSTVPVIAPCVCVWASPAPAVSKNAEQSRLSLLSIIVRLIRSPKSSPSRSALLKAPEL